MSVEIIVNREKVEAIGKKMDALAAGLESRKMKVSVVNSKGAAVDNLLAFARELENVGNVMRTHIMSTAQMLRDTVDQFETDMDGKRIFGK